MRWKQRGLALFFLQALLVLALFSVSFAQTQVQKPLDKVIEGAKREGKIVVYASYTYEEGEELHAAFRKKYPFIKFEHLSMGGADPVTRVVMESRAGSASADLVITGGTTALPLIKEALVREVDWASLGVQKGAIDGPHQVTVATVTYILVWNTKLVPPEGAPKGWEDLLDPRWKGKIGLWASPFAFSDLVPVWGEAKVLDYVKKLMQNKPVIISEGAEMPNRVAAGEVSVAVIIDSTIRPVAQKGAPVKWIWPDPIPMVRYNANVIKAARNQNAAILYCTWLTSPEGAATYEKATWRGNAFVAGSPIAQKTKGRQYSVWPTNQADRRAAVVKQLTKLQMP